MREAVIVEALRTPIGRGKMGRGGLSGIHPVKLLGEIQQAVIDKAGIDPKEVEQVIGGCVTQAGEQACNVTRNAWLERGNGWHTGGTTVDTQCGSGQQANHLISALVRAGSIDCGIACGVEVMSHVGLGANVTGGPGFFIPEDYPWDQASTQFEAAERIAKKAGITREDVDALALASQQKAAAARSEGRFKREIFPIEAPVLGDDMKPTGETRVIDADEGIRESTLEGLAKLKPVAPGGIHTAGNSSQISDGAAAVVVADRAAAESAQLPIIAEIVSYGQIAGPDATLHERPAQALEVALKRANLEGGDIDLFEINEAFASVAIWSAHILEIDHDTVNVNGGAVALGHPLGATGARIMGTLLNALQHAGGTLGAVALCGGGGQGDAMIVRML